MAKISQREGSSIRECSLGSTFSISSRVVMTVAKRERYR